MLLFVWALLTHECVAQERRDPVEPPIRVLLVEETGRRAATDSSAGSSKPASRVPALEAAIGSIVLERGLALGEAQIESVPPIDRTIGMPDAATWDLAVLVPGPILDAAFEKGLLARLEITSRGGAGTLRRPFLLADVAVYGLVELDERPRPLPWSALGAKAELAMPDLEREPEFLDALAGLLRRRSTRGFQKIWWGARQNRTSTELRRAARDLRPLRGHAILRLEDTEIPSFEDLPTARLGVAVSARAPRAVRDLAVELCTPQRLESWLGARPRLGRFGSRLALPPTAAEVKRARAFAFQPFRGEADDLPDWITTVLLTLFVVVIGVVFLRSNKRKSRLSGSR